MDKPEESSEKEPDVFEDEKIFKEKYAEFYKEMRRRGVEILPPKFPLRKRPKQKDA